MVDTWMDLLLITVATCATVGLVLLIIGTIVSLLTGVTVCG